jgi:L-glyceraldehyde 3-phosphate reductase
MTEPAPRDDRMPYRRAGRSGLRLPAISLGLWHNFGSVDAHDTARDVLLRAFDLGVTHFDLANNYGPAPGSAEETFGRVLARDLAAHRDEIVVSTKAGYRMWPGPYGDGGSRKYLLASLDASLRRLGLDYVDVFYHHRPDAETPLEESMLALDHAVRQGKALYVALSNYGPDATRAAVEILRELRTPLVLHQPKYSMLVRAPEEGLFDVLRETGLGCVVYSPLAQGLLTDRYADGVPADSRAAKPHGFLQADAVTERRRAQVAALREIAERRGESVARLALAWALRDPVVTSALVGASSVAQLEQNVAAAHAAPLTPDELSAVERALVDRSPGGA